MKLILIVLLFGSNVSVSAEEVASRPIIQSSLSATLDFGLSPLSLKRQDLLWLLPSAAAIGLSLNSDLPLYRLISTGDARQDWLDKTMPALSVAGEGLYEFAGATAFALLGDERMARTSRIAMQGLIVTAIWSQVFKYAAWSNRPSTDDTQHRFFAYDQASTGFPSGHAFSAFTLAEIYGAEYGRGFTYPLAALVGYSRIYNHAHWSSDVLAGSILGIIVGVQMNRLAAKSGAPVLRWTAALRGETQVMVANFDY